MSASSYEFKADNWKALSEAAWFVRENAYILGETKVGAAVLGSDGKIYVGCNVEHKFRSHDIHAEINAISSMVAAGAPRLLAILIAAKRARFTPCGACMDWILQFGGPKSLVAFQPEPAAELEIYAAHDLMPHYPT